MRTRRRFTPATAGTWLLLALLPLLSHRGAAQVAPSTTLTFSSTADTYVDGGSATTNFNSSTILRAVAAQAPTVIISQPPTGSSYFTGDTITLQASAHDSANVDLSSHVTWSSNLAGSLGTGAVVSTSLGAGTHTITASVTDGQSLTGSSQVTLTVNTPPPG